MAAVELAREQMLEIHQGDADDELQFFNQPHANFSVGFMSVVGSPNAGKSTLLNAILGDKLSIVSPKPQTTRHEIVGVLTTDKHQLIVRDTPGVLQPSYALQASMMKAVKHALTGADVYLLLVDATEPAKNEHGEAFSPVVEEYARLLNKTGKPVIVGLNKIDKLGGIGHRLKEHRQVWKSLLPLAEIQEVSALHGTHLKQLLDRILHHLPKGPLLYPNNTFTDVTERFYASEIIREQLFLNYKQEIPYSSEVVIESFKDTDEVLSISATVYVARKTQVPIVVGRQGESLKKIIRSSAEELSTVHGKPVKLHINVRVATDWNKDASHLFRFGYQPEISAPGSPKRKPARKRLAPPLRPANR